MLEPQEVVVPAGGKQEVSVVFKAEGAASYKQLVSIHISERDPADFPDGIPFELGGESCIPGALQEAPFRTEATVHHLNPSIHEGVLAASQNLQAASPGCTYSRPSVEELAARKLLLQAI
jgi:hydrocephalus-inducing protein